MSPAANKRNKALKDSKDKKIYHEVKRKVSKSSTANDPVISYTSRIRAIGNSQGIILNNEIMRVAKLEPNMTITIQAENDRIIISKADEEKVNTDLSTWDHHFKMAIKKGAIPEGDLFNGLSNDFDDNEW